MLHSFLAALLDHGVGVSCPGLELPGPRPDGAENLIPGQRGVRLGGALFFQHSADKSPLSNTCLRGLRKGPLLQLLAASQTDGTFRHTKNVLHFPSLVNSRRTSLRNAAYLRWRNGCMSLMLLTSEPNVSHKSAQPTAPSPTDATLPAPLPAFPPGRGAHPPPPRCCAAGGAPIGGDAGRWPGRRFCGI